MTSQVDYSRAAKGAVLAFAVQHYLNQGSPASAIVLGIVGNLGIALCNKVGLEMRSITIAGPGEFPFQIRSNLEIKPLENEEGIKEALERIENDYPDEYEEFLKQHGLFSKKEFIGFFRNRLNEGCCYGYANALFDKICRGMPTSLPESICILQKEDIFYHQILQDFRFSECAFSDGIDWAAEELVGEKELDQIGKSFDPEDDLSNPEVKKGQIEAAKTQIQKSIENLKRNDHARSFFKSEKFPMETTANIYREILENAMLAFPGEQDVIGIIHIPQHVVSFQYGPRGYFLSDTYGGSKKGLFEYVDPNTFCTQLRAHVLYDIRRYTLIDIPENEQGFRKKVEERIMREQASYSIRPLRQINPFVEARELPPVNRGLSEGWKTFFAQKEEWKAFISRKLEFYTHTLASTTLQARDYIWES